MNIKPFRYGAVLKITRQDTLSNIEKQFSMMRDCGMNTAVVWPAFFWWEEKKEGYPYNTGKEILKTAQKYNIGVIMELAGQLTVCEYIPVTRISVTPCFNSSISTAEISSGLSVTISNL